MRTPIILSVTCAQMALIDLVTIPGLWGNDGLLTLRLKILGDEKILEDLTIGFSAYNFCKQRFNRRA